MWQAVQLHLKEYQQWAISCRYKQQWAILRCLFEGSDLISPGETHPLDECRVHRTPTSKCSLFGLFGQNFENMTNRPNTYCSDFGELWLNGKFEKSSMKIFQNQSFFGTNRVPIEFEVNISKIIVIVIINLIILHSFKNVNLLAIRETY